MFIYSIYSTPVAQVISEALKTDCLEATKFCFDKKNLIAKQSTWLHSVFLDLLIWTTLIPSHSLICTHVDDVNTNMNFLFPWKLELWPMVPLSKVTTGLERKLRGQILRWCKLAQFHWSQWKSTNLHVWTSGPTVVINRILPKRNVFQAREKLK